jgi:hypothetical protein
MKGACRADRALEKDLTLALSAERLRIEAPVPGKPYVVWRCRTPAARSCGFGRCLKQANTRRVTRP